MKGKTPMTQLQTTPEMFEFMMKKLGGANMVRVEFFKDKIASLANSNTTIDEVMKEAKSEGWDTWFTGLRFSDLSRMLGASKSISVKTTARSGKRLTNTERDDLLKNILDFLKDNPWSSAKVIAKHVGMPSRNIGLQLKSLREKNQIKTQGEKASMRYSLA
jgi:DNA-binding transcriptional ArsR family regulator